jgi:hypothetical protein
MKYCQNVTISHNQCIVYPGILTDVFSLIKKEGCRLNPSPFSGKTHKVIDGDKLEEEVRLSTGRTNLNKSVDLIFGLRSSDGSVEQIQFVELKLRSQQDFYFLDKFSLRDKVNSSTLALGTSVPIANKYYIVFKKNLLNQAQRYLFRINPKLNNDFKAIDVELLNTLFF